MKLGKERKKEQKMNTKGNQRAMETEQKIKKAFLELLEKKELNKITVSEICSLAQIHRTTFYVHYLDVTDLMEKLTASMYKEVVELLLKEGGHEEPENKLEELFEMIYEKKYFFKVYLSISVWQKNVREEFPAALRDHIKELMPLMDCESEEEFYYRQLFFNEGLVAMIRRWLERDCAETPAQMSRMVERQMTQAFFRDGKKGENCK